MKRRRCMGLETVIGLALWTLAVLSQGTDAFGAQSAPKLNIVIIEGDGAINNVKQRVAREVIVQVNDENNRPIGGGAVAFLLPSSGPGGFFSGGSNVLNVTTNTLGRATAQFTPNTLSGSFQISVNASYQGQVASTAIPQTNSLAAASSVASSEAATGAGGGTGISAATVVLIVAAAAGAVAVGVAMNGKGKNAPAPSASAPTIRIGAAGTPTIGTPGFQQSGRMASPVPVWR